MRHLFLPTAGVAPQQRALLLVGAVTLLWAVIEGIGAVLPDQPSPYQVVWVRYAVHLLFLVAVFGPRHRSGLWRTRRLLPQLGRGLLMLGMPVLYVFSVRYLSPASTWSIFWLAPLLALAAAAIVLRERVRPPVWLATAAAYGGVLVILHPHADLLQPAVVLALGMAGCLALYLIGSRLLRDEALLPSLFYTALGVLVPLSLRLPHFWRPLSWLGGLEMAGIGLLGLLLLYCLDKALELAELHAVAPFLLVTPIWIGGVERLLWEGAGWPSLIVGCIIIVSTLHPLLLYDKRETSSAAGAATPLQHKNASSRESKP